MAAIGPKNTKPELVVRRLLHAAGLRFRLHRKDLPASLTSTCRSTVPLSRSTDASGTRMTATSSSSQRTMRSSGPISSAGNVSGMTATKKPSLPGASAGWLCGSARSMGRRAWRKKICSGR